MARLGYGMSVSGSKTPVVASGGAAPSGIPVASTSQIIVTSTNAWILSSPFDKISAVIFVSLADEEVFLEYLGENGWNFFAGGDIRAYALGSADFIPTSGYTIVSGGGNITITAA